MTYPKSFSEIQLARLRLLVPQIEALAEGESLRIHTSSPAASAELRYLVYAWLSPEHSGRKDEFRIRACAAREDFFIERRVASFAISVEKIAPPAGEHPLLEQIVGIVDEAEAEDAARRLAPTAEDCVRLMSDWRRVHGVG